MMYACQCTQQTGVEKQREAATALTLLRGSFNRFASNPTFTAGGTSKSSYFNGGYEWI
jgi:hypothetical protein